ncbi:MAG TPA: acetylglucosamine-6-sulfatase, partial [Blastocatellia bacterium]|nr:acetylglucosamine-6-sulfatase [Blastocatellia bacterium]
MKHRYAWLCIICVLLFSGAVKTQAQRSSAAKTKPNILILYADDWRHDTLSLAGNPVVKTPNLDQLAKQGV